MQYGFGEANVKEILSFVNYSIYFDNPGLPAKQEAIIVFNIINQYISTHYPQQKWTRSIDLFNADLKVILNKTIREIKKIDEYLHTTT